MLKPTIGSDGGVICRDGSEDDDEGMKGVERKDRDVGSYASEQLSLRYSTFSLEGVKEGVLVVTSWDEISLEVAGTGSISSSVACPSPW